MCLGKCAGYTCAMRLIVTVMLIFIPAGSLGGKEPSADKEPSAHKEPSADKEPSAGMAPSMFEQGQLAAAAGKYEAVIGVLADESLSSSARTKYTRRIDRYNNGIPFQL